MAKQLTEALQEINAVKPDELAQTPPPSIMVLIDVAVSATQHARDLQAEVDAAKVKAREAFDGVYAELARMKSEIGDMDTFRSSKLGKLLENIR